MAIVWDTDFETDQWSLSGSGSNTWEYESAQGEPRTTDHGSAVISNGRDGTGRAVWLGTYNGHAKRNDIARDDIATTGETWLGFSLYVNEAVPASRVYAQLRNRVHPDDPLKGTGIAVKNPITLRQHSNSGKMYFAMLTDPAYAELVNPDTGGASADSVAHPSGGFEYNLNEWIDIVMHWTALSADGGTVRIWVNGDKIIDHTGVTNYRYHPLSGHVYSGKLKHTIGAYWANAGNLGSVYFDNYKIWDGSGGTYEDVHPIGASPNSPTVDVTAVAFTTDVQTINQGESVNLSLDWTPTDATNKSYSLSSDDLAVIDDNGNWVGEGTATLTVTAGDTSNNASDTMAVTCNAAGLQPTIKRRIRLSGGIKGNIMHFGSNKIILD